MATYKLIQDIEAEDKILGPLTLRQFIFALIAVFLGYLNGISIVKGAPFLVIIFLPPFLFFGFFALPFGRDQPTEIWALAKLRYFFKPRRRIWNQSGVKEMVTITVPKRIERIYSDGLSQREVHSRLQALANTIDSHGWAVKNVVGTGYATHSLTASSSDRLIGLSALPVADSVDPLTPSEDMLDTVNNPLAQQFDTMINQSTNERRQEIISRINGAPGTTVTPQIASDSGSAQAADVTTDSWFTGPTQPATALSAKQGGGAMPNPSDVLAELQSEANAKNHKDSVSVNGNSSSEVTAQSRPGIMTLAKNNDLNVATLAREANRMDSRSGQFQDEVVIALH